jgi:hypothetical protein
MLKKWVMKIVGVVETQVEKHDYLQPVGPCVEKDVGRETTPR